MNLAHCRLKILAYVVLAIPWVATEVSAQFVAPPDSIVFREPFITQDGLVIEEDVEAPSNIVFRLPFISSDGLVIEDSVDAPTRIAFRDVFVDDSGNVLIEDVPEPLNIVFREPFIDDAGNVIEEYVDPPDGIVFRLPFVDEAGGVIVVSVREPEFPDGKLLLLNGIYPNPFNPGTRISFHLDQPAQVEVVVLDLKGRRVRTLHSGPLTADLHVMHWDGQTDSGADLASGLYIFRIVAGAETLTSKALLVR